MGSTPLRQNFLVLLVAGLSIFVGLPSVKQVHGAKIDCFPINGATKEQCETLGCIWQPSNGTTPTSLDGNTTITQFGHYFPGQQSLPNAQISQQQKRVSEPWCYFPENYVGYEIVENSLDKNGKLRLTRKRPSVLGKDDIKELVVEINEFCETGNHTLRVKIYDANRARFEPAIPKIDKEHYGSCRKDKYNGFEVTLDGPHRLEIRRKANSEHQDGSAKSPALFSTDLSKLIFTDRFIQVSTRLTSRFVYGLGEHYDTFLKYVGADYKLYSFYNRDRLPLPGGTNSYGGFPFMVNYETNTTGQPNKRPAVTGAHGVFLLNSNAMDIILQGNASSRDESLLATYRPTGGLLDFYIFAGPRPLEVVQQYQQLVGLPMLPPKWALGFHLCRYNYGSLAKVREVWNRTRAAGIPFDVQWNDIDMMQDHNDFTYDQVNFKGLPEFVDELHRHHMHYVPILDPGISQQTTTTTTTTAEQYEPYVLGEKLDIFVKNATNQVLVGKVWNQSGRTVFVDFSHRDIDLYWGTLFVHFHQRLPFDGAWIDMNDISNFVDGSLDGCPTTSTTAGDQQSAAAAAIENPPYVPRATGEPLQRRSLCLSARHQAGLEFDVHNLYSFYEAMATYRALQAARRHERPFIISRSTFAGQGAFSGHWSGDVPSNWDYLKWSVIQLVEHSMYGYSMIGSDICGFVGNTTSELCARWSTLGAFYTFSRNHNDDVSVDQDPVALGSDVIEANKNALTKRYSLLPYLYHLMIRANLYGEPVVQSVAFGFFEDPEALKVEYQFMWGDALMVSPVVEPQSFKKGTYLPRGRWYETDILPAAAGQLKVPKPIDSLGEWHETKGISLTNLPLFYRGGLVVPYHVEVKQTVFETERQQIGFEVALDETGRARGSFVIELAKNGSSSSEYGTFAMQVANSTLTISSRTEPGDDQLQVGSIKVLGVGFKVSRIIMKRTRAWQEAFVQRDHVLAFNVTLVRGTDEFTIQWI